MRYRLVRNPVATKRNSGANLENTNEAQEISRVIMKIIEYWWETALPMKTIMVHYVWKTWIKCFETRLFAAEMRISYSIWSKEKGFKIYFSNYACEKHLKKLQRNIESGEPGAPFRVCSVAFRQVWNDKEEYSVCRLSCPFIRAKCPGYTKAALDSQWTYVCDIYASMLYWQKTGMREKKRW